MFSTNAVRDAQTKLQVSDTLNDAKLSYRSMTPEVRSLFPQVVVLLKLLLVCSVSSCECEKELVRGTNFPRNFDLGDQFSMQFWSSPANVFSWNLT